MMMADCWPTSQVMYLHRYVLNFLTDTGTYTTYLYVKYLSYIVPIDSAAEM